MIFRDYLVEVGVPIPEAHQPGPMTRSTASLTMELGSNVCCKRRIGHVEERERRHLGHVADHQLKEPAVRGHDQVPQGLNGPRPGDTQTADTC